MDWVTQEQAKEAAKQGELPALECSWEHHEQGRDRDWVELKEAIENDKFWLSWELCACCRFVGKQDGFKDNGCRKCPLGDFFCWDNIIWAKVRNSWTKLTNHFSNANFKAFQEDETELCTYIEGVIEKVKLDMKAEKYKECEPELRHGELVQGGSMGKVYVAMDTVPKSDRWHIWADWGKNGTVSKSDTYYTGLGINIFDDLKRNSEDLKEYMSAH